MKRRMMNMRKNDRIEGVEDNDKKGDEKNRSHIM